MEMTEDETTKKLDGILADADIIDLEHVSYELWGKYEPFCHVIISGAQNNLNVLKEILKKFSCKIEIFSAERRPIIINIYDEGFEQRENYCAFELMDYLLERQQETIKQIRKTDFINLLLNKE